tara:strand:- start:1532 stop:2728 length:1197 start_codon:yes stop_codon:yes gene_type:complete
MNNIRKKIWICGIFMIVGILFISSFVIALGVSPTQKIVYYDGSEYFGKFFIFNDGGSKTVSIGKSGDLADYLVLERKSINFNEGETMKVVGYTLDVPKNVARSGDNYITFIISESSDPSSTGTFVGASLNLLTSVLLRVPYPDKYVEPKLRFINGDQGGRVILIVTVSNRGPETIDKIKVDLKILNPSGDIIDKLGTTHTNLENGRNEDLRMVWHANVDPGSYDVDAVIRYDGKKTKVEGSFLVGEKKIDIKEIFIDKFKLGDSVAKFGIKLQNNWNEDIGDVYAIVYLYDLNGNLITSAKTKKTEVYSRGATILEGFLDTGSLDEGTYESIITLHYGKRSLERVIKMEVGSKKISFKGSGMVIHGFDYGINSGFIAGLIILVFINIVWFLYFSRKKR